MRWEIAKGKREKVFHNRVNPSLGWQKEKDEGELREENIIKFREFGATK